MNIIKFDKLIFLIFTNLIINSILIYSSPIIQSDNKLIEEKIFNNSKFDNQTQVSHFRTIHLIYNFQSWFVGLILTNIQKYAGKTILPDSKILYIQRLVNPFIVIDHLIELKNQNYLLINKIYRNPDKFSIQKLNLNLTNIQNFTISLLNYLKPVINVGFYELNKLDETHVIDPLIDPALDEFLGTTLPPENTDSNMLTNQFKKTDSNQLNLKLDSSLNKHKIQSRAAGDDIELNLNQTLNLNQFNSSSFIESNLIINSQNLTLIEPNLISLDENVNNDQYFIADNKTNKQNIKVLNQTQSKIVNELMNCNIDKCNETILISNTESPLNQNLTNLILSYSNQTHYQLIVKKANQILNGLVNLFLIRPSKWIEIHFKQMINFIRLDLKLIYEMFQTLTGSNVVTCRYKFICELSSFSSLHTPNFLRNVFPFTTDNLYVRIVELANKYESLNAFVTGYIGFDCNEFYVHKSCSNPK